MEYALPETKIGVKWECVWNGIVFTNFHFSEQTLKQFLKYLWSEN